MDKKQFISQALIEDSLVKVVITREVTPEEAEARGENPAYILVKGMSWRDDADGVPFLNQHNNYGSLIDNLLGRVVNLQKKKVDGANSVIGEIKFAESPNGRIAEQLYRSGIARDVSVGVSIEDFDPATQAITKSRLYEVSGVTIGANEYAKVIQGLDLDFNVEAMVKNYVDIRPRLKQYRKLFMSDELFQLLGVTKTGDELVDLKVIHEAFKSSLKKQATETPEPEQPAENQPELATKDDLMQVLNKYFIQS